MIIRLVHFLCHICGNLFLGIDVLVLSPPQKKAIIETERDGDEVALTLNIHRNVTFLMMIE